MSKPEVVGYFHSFKVECFRVSLSHFTLRPDAYTAIFGDECKAHPVIWLADHEAERAADKARIEELENSAASALAVAEGGNQSHNMQVIGRILREALAQQGKEGEA